MILFTSHILSNSTLFLDKYKKKDEEEEAKNKYDKNITDKDNKILNRRSSSGQRFINDNNNNEAINGKSISKNKEKSFKRNLKVFIYSCLNLSPMIACCFLSFGILGEKSSSNNFERSLAQIILFTVLFVLSIISSYSYIKKDKDIKKDNFWNGYFIQLPMMSIMLDSMTDRTDLITISSGIISSLLVAWLGKSLVSCNRLREKLISFYNFNDVKNNEKDKTYYNLIKSVDDRSRAMLFSSSMATWSIILVIFHLFIIFYVFFMHDSIEYLIILPQTGKINYEIFHRFAIIIDNS
jgi:hypothetical protein